GSFAPRGQEGGSEQGLRRICEDRIFIAAAGLLFATTEQQVLPQAEAAGNLSERNRRNDSGTALGELTFGHIGEGLVQHRRDGKAENRVAQEFEALVVRNGSVLVSVGAVRQR